SMPQRDPVAAEPKVRVARGVANPARIYRYLLESPYDAKLLEHLITGQLALIDVSNGQVTRIGEPSMVRSVVMSPGAGQFRVTNVTKPFSYHVPFLRFGSQEGLYSLEGKNLFTLADKKLREFDAQQGGAPAAKNPGKKGGKGAVQPPPDPNPDDPKGDNQAIDPDAKRLLVWRPD